MLTITRKNALFLSIVLSLLVSGLAAAQNKQNELRLAGVPILWRDPGNVSARNLQYGPGSAALAPVGPFSFVSEEQTGESPKFRVTDARGETWIVKLGIEAQAETVATRLIWSVGYFADEAYYLDRVEIKNLPTLSRGQNFVENKLVIRGARFEPKRKGIDRGANWDWEENPFVETRELDGLKVMMVLLGNYDTRVANNKILTTQGTETGGLEARYVATDVGATFGKVGGLAASAPRILWKTSARVNLSSESIRASLSLITTRTPKGMGKFASFFKPSYRSSQARKARAMSTVTVENARWIGSLLARVSDGQLRDAFRAANYDRDTTEGFVQVLLDRIDQLNRLDSTGVTAAVKK